MRKLIMSEGQNWKDVALAGLDMVRKDLEATTKKTGMVIVTISEEDMNNLQPVTIYANASWSWIHRVLLHAAWRTALKLPLGTVQATNAEAIGIDDD